ncbi:hypothetical protein DNH61_09930 [Paenibacillus sambharensis]|uniref:Uncharacterized protein n=1 Tax=Paenibacillus sambharensis TaxID=1803190 RepID=A0A2W1LWB0_9BACL|nr:hypothetical protein [Paenibacillus sambharensis]PZD95767.1 hypothetical protein DNH61_09930 [Paenibacillus sambharensis]
MSGSIMAIFAWLLFVAVVNGPYWGSTSRWNLWLSVLLSGAAALICYLMTAHHGMTSPAVWIMRMLSPLMPSS